MTVKITKAALNLREELADLRKPSGIAGEAVLRADSVQEQRDLIGAGRKNLIINGGFDVWQRGTSSSTKGNYTADRWKHHFYSSGSITTTKQASGLVDFPNCVRVQRPSGTTGTHDLCLNYAMESQDCSRLVGKTLTLSYWMRKGSDFAGHTMRAVLMFGTGVDDYINYDYFATHRVSSYSNGAIRRYITPTSNWERITETYQVHADTTQIGVAFASDYDSTSGTAGANDYIEITGVQLELGSVATEFEHRSYGEELALCQRYFQKSYTGSTTSGVNAAEGCAVFYGDGTTGYHGGYRFVVPMRVAPAINLWTKNGTETNQAQQNFTSGAYVDIQVYAASATSFNLLQTDAGVVSIYAFHYYADAEL